MRRREFIVGLGAAAAWPLAARAQTTGKPLRVGTVAITPRAVSHWAAFERRMADLGYVEGRTFIFDYVRISGVDASEAGFHELMARKPDVIVTTGPEFNLKGAMAAAGATPIVMIAVDFDPLARGYVASLGRPGGNVTGLSLQQIDLTIKRLQFFTQAVPAIRKATMFWDSISKDQWQAARSAGPGFGVQLAGVDLGAPPLDYDRALAQAPDDYRSHLFMGNSPLFFADRAGQAKFALRNRMTSMFAFRQWVEVGGLVSYGPSITGIWSHAADYVDRIARGAKPAELPIEQPTKFELVVNLTTARTLGLEFPPMVLARADEVIE